MKEFSHVATACPVVTRLLSVPFGSAAALAGIAAAESSEGRRTDCVPLLEAKLAKARQIQDELPALANGREAEQAVAAVFLHSQPIGHKVNTPNLAAGSLTPDAIELEKGLHRWQEIS